LVTVAVEVFSGQWKTENKALRFSPDKKYRDKWCVLCGKKARNWRPEAGEKAGKVVLFFREKTDKMFRKGGSNLWKNAPKPLERQVRSLVKLTKCIGRTGQTFGRTDSNLWKNGSNSWK
jgi:hypothetical protein